MLRRPLLLIAALVATTAALAKAPRPPVAPPSAGLCAACHGANGVSSKPGVPHLNGQLPDNIVESLAQFKDGKRPSSAPAHADAALTAGEVEALANFYSAQKDRPRPEQPVDAAKVAAGEALYKRRCTKCHLDSGRDADHEAPLVAGQALDYLQAQTTAFVTGKRKFPFLMDEAYDGLSPEDLERLSHYFASQK